MGNNNVASLFRHRGSLPFPCHLQLGGDSSINLTTSVSNNGVDGSYLHKGVVLYTVEGSTCKLMLGRVADKHLVNFVTLLLHDSIACSDREKLHLEIRRSEIGFLTFEYKSNSDNSSIPWTKTKKKFDAWGGVTDTKLYFYGSANRCGLLVWECNKNYNLQRVKTVTVAHYFVHSSGTGAVNRSSETTDIGFSVVVKIAESDGKFDITVEGPEQHPVSALLYMFDEVKRSEIWKPSMCPHCGNIRRSMSSQSDSEDSDGRQTNARRIYNDGRFNGHANGSSIRCRYFYAFS